MDDDKINTGLSGLQAMVMRAGKGARGVAPVEKWEPDYCGELDMEIARDGTWFYMGTPIGRAALVQLFSTVLRKDKDGETYLVTPVEKIRIRVVDAPFVGVEMNLHHDGDEPVITVRTNVGDIVEIGPKNPLRFVKEKDSDGVKPYVLIRGRLEALLSRAVMYELISHGEEMLVDGVAMFAIESMGEKFAIMEAAELERLSQ